MRLSLSLMLLLVVVVFALSSGSQRKAAKATRTKTSSAPRRSVTKTKTQTISKARNGGAKAALKPRVNFKKASTMVPRKAAKVQNEVKKAVKKMAQKTKIIKHRVTKAVKTKVKVLQPTIVRPTAKKAKKAWKTTRPSPHPKVKQAKVVKKAWKANKGSPAPKIRKAKKKMPTEKFNQHGKKKVSISAQKLAAGTKKIQKLAAVTKKTQKKVSTGAQKLAAGTTKIQKKVSTGAQKLTAGVKKLAKKVVGERPTGPTKEDMQPSQLKQLLKQPVVSMRVVERKMSTTKFLPNLQRVNPDWRNMHSGLEVITADGGRYLIHKGGKYGRVEGGDTVVTDAINMSPEWQQKSTWKQPEKPPSVSDLVRQGGKDYSGLFNNCNKASRIMYGKDED